VRYPFGGAEIDSLYRGGSGSLTWREVVAELNRRYPGVGLSSGIPVRQVWYEWCRQNQHGFRIDIDDVEAIVALRDEGEGWGKLSARTGAPELKVKRAYVKGGGRHPTTGRIYIKGTQPRHHPGAAHGPRF
jgi:hypothetical protein